MSQVLTSEYYENNLSKKGVLLIHGWTAGPANVRSLAKALQAKGYSVYCPLLRGHGCSSREEFLRATGEEWLSQSMEEAKKFFSSQKFEEISLIGHSLGALLALNIYLSGQFPGLSHLVLLAPALFAQNKTIYLTPLVKHFVQAISKKPEPTLYPLDPVTDELYQKNYWANLWVSPACELLRVQKYVLQKLKKDQDTKGPHLLTVFAEDDESVDVKASLKALEGVNGGQNKIEVLKSFGKNNGHELLFTEQKEPTIKRVLEFLDLK